MAGAEGGRITMIRSLEKTVLIAVLVLPLLARAVSAAEEVRDSTARTSIERVKEQLNDKDKGLKKLNERLDDKTTGLKRLNEKLVENSTGIRTLGSQFDTRI